MPPIVFVVDRRQAGQTLAAVLKVRFGLSWSQAKRLVEKGHVRVGGQVETDVARRLKAGKRVELAAGTVEARSAESGTSNKKPKPAAVSRDAKRSGAPKPQARPQKQGAGV